MIVSVLEIGGILRFNSSVISFGPYLTPKGMPARISEDLCYTGFVLEFSGEKAAGTVPIFCNDLKNVAFDDLKFRGVDTFCTVKVISCERPDYAPLEALITALYLKHKPQTPLLDLLADIRERIHLAPGKFSTHRRQSKYKGLLHDKFAKAGFELIGFWQYGRTLTTRIGWVFPQDRENPNAELCLYATCFESTPTPDRNLGKGKWITPMEVVVSYLFTRMLREMCPRNPVDMLNDKGKQLAGETYKWIKASLLTPKELKAARIEFIREHPELHQNRLELAKALIKDGLYSDTTQYTAIYKQLPGLIAAGSGT